MNKRIRKKKGLPYKKIPFRDLINLDFTLAQFIIPRLERFKEEAVGWPAISFETFEDWMVAIDKMIWSFKYAINDDSFLYDEEKEKRYEEGMELFSRYFRNLWV